jgi:hypothetical protein
MSVPATYLTYAPRGPGLLCAVVYTVADKDVCGWWIGSQEGEFSSAFFMLENYYSIQRARFYASRGSDIYGGWQFDYTASPPELEEPLPVAEEMCHALNGLQSAFVAEWLFFAGDDAAAGEAAAYERSELALRQVNIRSARLNKLDKGDAVWSHASHGLDLRVIDTLKKGWPLDFRSD